MDSSEARWSALQPEEAWAGLVPGSRGPAILLQSAKRQHLPFIAFFRVSTTLNPADIQCGKKAGNLSAREKFGLQHKL